MDRNRVQSQARADCKTARRKLRFKRMRVEQSIWLWSRSALKVIVKDKGSTFPFPAGYVPRIEGAAVAIEGEGLIALEAARSHRDYLLRLSQASGSAPSRNSLDAMARKTTLADAFELVRKKLRNQIANGTRKPDTLRGYESHWPAVEEKFGAWPLSRFANAPHVLEKWFTDQQERVSPCTVYHYRQLLSRCFNIAARLGRFPYQNPACNTEPIELPKAEEGRGLTEVEGEALLLAALDETRNKGRWHAMFAVMLLTGLRIHEVTRLCWEDFDWDTRMLEPADQKRGNWLFEITPELEAVVKAWADPLPTGYLFPSERGTPVSYNCALRALRRIAKRAGISDYQKLGTHVFRRTATRAFKAEANGDTHAFMKTARQTDMKVAERYLKKMDPQARDLARRTAKRLAALIPLPPKR